MSRGSRPPPATAPEDSVANKVKLPNTGRATLEPGANSGAQRLLKIFNETDTNADGHINYAEFRRAVFKNAEISDNLWVRDIPSHTLYAFFARIDTDRDDLISFKELRDAWPSLSQQGFMSALHSFVTTYDPDFNSEFSVRPNRQDRTAGLLPSLLGGLASSVSKTVTSPLERLRVYYQTGYPGGESVANRSQLQEAVKRIYAEGGVAAFWRGNLLNCIKIAPETAINFAVFEASQRYFQDWERTNSISSMNRLVSGAIAGVVSQAAVYPVDTIRTRMMSTLDAGSASASSSPSSLFMTTFREIRQTSGIPGFFRGIVPASAGIAPYSGIYFLSYETLKSRFGKGEGGSSAILGIGSVAAVIAGVSTYPLGLIRTRMMASGTPSHPFVYSSTWDCIRQTYLREGIAGFYRGQVITLAKSVPSSAVSFYMYERGKQWLKARDRSSSE
ncbi:mitochondrial carrier domain-containing protein [Hyaloraphidium curvatum]|nr:mitochondrial carrier domain-containing protein [Hyaloraphidium curvatum]